MLGGYLLEVKDGGETVAYIDRQGGFTCLDKPRMLRALRLGAVQMENMALRLRGVLPPAPESTAEVP